MIDSHCHINDELYVKNPEKYIKEACSAGVFKFLVVGFDLNSSIAAIRISEKFDNCYAAIGIHPSDIKKANPNDIAKIEKLTNNNKVIAIGEIGLDYYWDKEETIKESQRVSFVKQIEIANKMNLPISIHCRDALEDCLNILKKYPVKNGGIMHCYSGSVEMAREFIKLGFLLGIGGTLTFKNSVKPKEIVSEIPLDYLVLETDSPYLTPVPFRGQPNHSKYLSYVRDEIARIKNITPEEVDKVTDSNFLRLFKL